MQEVQPIGSDPTILAVQNQNSIEQTATDAFGLNFESLVRIVLTQLTFQDPLKPIENTEFVSQLAQYSQIQQTDTMSRRLLSIAQSDAATQATSLLGKEVDIPAGPTILTGVVSSISFQAGEPRLTIVTDDDRTISNIRLASISQIRQGE